jgi:uncharacterized protein
LFTSQCNSNYVPQDTSAAAAWYQEAAEKGYAKAMNNLAYLYFTGEISATQQSESEKQSNAAPPQRKPDYALALQWFNAAAALGNAGALNNLGICSESGCGVPRSDEQAMHFYLQAAQCGHPSAQASLGYLYLKLRHFGPAKEWLQIAAETGHGEAEYHLAQMYHHGLACDKSDVKAFDLYKRAADRQHHYAQLETAHSYFSGRGCAKDIYKAYDYYSRAAAAGVAEAENSCGIMREEGVGCSVDLQAARQWYEKAAAKGCNDALFNLGLMY